MKALQCVELGMPDKLQVNEVPEPELLDGHVLIENKACSINFPDVLMIQGLYQFQPELPFIPGGESAGIVSAVGEGVEGINVGDRVFAMTGLGAFAEKILAPQHAVVKIPESMDFDTAAALPMTYGTSLYALKQRAELKEGETLLVLGAAGGVGLATVELGKAMGAKVIAAASTQEKIDLCLEHGADEAFIYPTWKQGLDSKHKKYIKEKEDRIAEIKEKLSKLELQAEEVNDSIQEINRPNDTAQIQKNNDILQADIVSSQKLVQKFEKDIAKLKAEGNGTLNKDQQKELSSKIKELTGGTGANVVYDPIGDAYSEPCIRATAWDGRYLVIGFAAGQIPKIPINLALLKGMKIVGVFWGAWVGMFPEENKKNFEELFKLHADGKINPEVSDSFSLDEGANAIAHLKDRKAKGKVIIKI